MIESVFEIKKMDCPSEESMIRMRLQDEKQVKQLVFDIANRKLTVLHDAQVESIAERIDGLKLDARLVSSGNFSGAVHADSHAQDLKLLWTVLVINAFFFAAESVAGIVGGSMGLLGDSLDMLADALVYGLSIYAIGRTAEARKNVARLSGYFQLALAFLGFFEVVRRFLYFNIDPNPGLMVGVSAFALVGNAVCLYLLQKSKSKEAHMQASMIFTSNDVIVNLGVMVAGGLVYLSQSRWPDLIVGVVVFALVLRGALRILKLSN